MKSAVKLLFTLAVPVTLVGCNKTNPIFTTKIKDVKTSSFFDLTFTNSVKDFKSAGFKYGDVIKFSFKNADGKEYKYTAPFVTNYCVAGLFNCSICDFEKSGQLTVSLGATEAYEDIDRKTNKDKYIDQQVTFELEESGKWNDINEKIDLSKRRTFNFIGRDNYVFTNTRDIKTVAGNLISSNIGAKKIYRMSSPFDDLENSKRYLNGDSIIGDLYHTNPKENPFYVLADLNYDDFTNTDGIDFFMRMGEDTNFHEMFASEASTNSAVSFNIGDNYFNKSNIENISKIFLGDKGIITKILEYCSKGNDRTNYAIILSDSDGIERAGFISLLLEALAGASYTTLVSDYMISYKNYYNILPYDDKKQSTCTLEKYNLLKSLTVDRLIYCLCNFDPNNPKSLHLGNVNWADVNVATKYIQDNGLDKDENKGKLCEAATKYLTNVFSNDQTRPPEKNIELLKQIIKGENING